MSNFDKWWAEADTERLIERNQTLSDVGRVVYEAGFRAGLEEARTIIESTEGASDWERRNMDTVYISAIEERIRQ
jgi:hypothetical protein